MAAAEKFKQQSEPVAQKPAVPKIEEDEEDEGEVKIVLNRDFDLSWPWHYFFWQVEVKSVILIYNLPTFNEVRNFTQNEPSFEILPQMTPNPKFGFKWPQIWKLTPDDHKFDI